jgi:hypothetical protein
MISFCGTAKGNLRTSENLTFTSLSNHLHILAPQIAEKFIFEARLGVLQL